MSSPGWLKELVFPEVQFVNIAPAHSCPIIPKLFLMPKMRKNYWELRLAVHLFWQRAYHRSLRPSRKGALMISARYDPLVCRGEEMNSIRILGKAVAFVGAVQ